MKDKKSEMNRRELTAVGMTSASLAAKNLAQSSTFKSSDTRPNILFIMVDQQHPGYFGYAGHPVVQTPNVDKLAKKGVSFSRAYCGNPLCMPSWAGVFTGLTTLGHRARMNGISLDPGIPTFTEGLRKSGYHTKAVGKLHFGSAVKPAHIPIENVNL